LLDNAHLIFYWHEVVRSHTVWLNFKERLMLLLRDMRQIAESTFIREYLGEFYTKFGYILG
jgi:hypothetical protein